MSFLPKMKSMKPIKLKNVILTMFMFIVLLGIVAYNPLKIKKITVVKNKLKEAFTNLNSRINVSTLGNYPQDTQTPLLSDAYIPTTTPTTSQYTAVEQSANYPSFPTKYTGTNNIRYWRRPTNGTCSNPDLCMALYKPKTTEQLQLQRNQENQVPSTNWSDVRVNAFAIEDVMNL